LNTLLLNLGKRVLTLLMRRIILIFVFASLVVFANSINLYSQPVTWVRIIGDSIKSMDGISVVQTYDGGYAVLGIKGVSAGDEKMLLMKFDYLGNLQWQKYPNDTIININPIKLVQTKDSGFVMLGYDFTSHNFLLKTDKNGNFLWRKYYPDTAVSQPRFYDFTKTLDNGFALCGTYDAYKSFTVTGYLIKTDSAGNVQWRKSYVDSLYTSFGSVTQFPDSCYYLGAAVYGTTNVLYGYAKKLRSNGDVVWTKYLLSNGGAGYPVQVTNSTIAFSSTLDTIGYYYKISYIDTSSNIIWQKTYSFPQQVNSLNSVFNSSIVITGFVLQGSTIGISKLSITDSSVFTKTFLHPGYTLIGARSSANTNDNGFIMVGNASINFKGFILIIKTDSLFNAPLITNISNIPESINDNFELYQNYPNPFNPSTSVRFYIPESGNVKFKVYDLLGREVLNLGNHFCIKGVNSFLFNTNQYSLSSGIYLFIVEYKSIRKSNKLVLIK